MCASVGSLKSLTFRSFTFGYEELKFVDIFAATLEVLDLGIDDRWSHRARYVAPVTEPHLALSSTFPRLSNLTLRGSTYDATSLLSSLAGSLLLELHLEINPTDLTSPLPSVDGSHTIHTEIPLPAIDLFIPTLRRVTIDILDDAEGLDVYDCETLKEFCADRNLSTSNRPGDVFYTGLNRPQFIVNGGRRVTSELEGLLEFGKDQLQRAVEWEENDRLEELRTALLGLRTLRIIWED